METENVNVNASSENVEEKMYEKAIAGYHNFVVKYKEWMYLYAIFVSVFFVAYYTLKAKVCNCNNDFEILFIVITVMGFLTSLCWLGAWYGHYRWYLSWTKILHFHEERYLKKAFREEDVKNHRVYTLVYEKAVKYLGFSTQKITGLFIRLVIMAWGFLFLLQSNIVSCWIYAVLWAVFGVLAICLFISLIIRIIKKKNRKCWLLSNTDPMYRLKDDGNTYNIELPIKKITLPENL